MRYNKVGTHLKSRRLLPSRLRRATVSLWLGHARALTPHCGVIHSPRAASLPLGGRLLVSPIITQIGRENKLSAEIFVPIISPLRMQRERAGLVTCPLFWGHSTKLQLVIRTPRHSLLWNPKTLDMKRFRDQCPHQEKHLLKDKYALIPSIHSSSFQ